MTQKPQIRDPEDSTVRPRLVWSGIGPALAGVIATGVGLMMQDLWLAWGGGAVTVVGLIVAWRGGVMFDTRGQEPPHHAVTELLEGGEHQGVSPAARVIDADSEARAATLTARKERLLSRAGTTPAPSMRPLAAFLLVALGGWLLVGVWILNYPFTVTGQNSALREAAFAVVVALSGLRLRMPSRSLAASTLCLLSGVLLIASGLLLPHDSSLVAVNEIGTGVSVLGLTALTFR